MLLVNNFNVIVKILKYSVSNIKISERETNKIKK